MASTPSSLVLGCATHLPASVFRPFVHSLRASGFQGRLGLVLGHYPPEQLREFAALADFTVAVSGEYEEVNARLVGTLRFLRSRGRTRVLYPAAFAAASRARGGRGAAARWRALELTLEGLQALRYAHYHEIVARAGADVDQVFITDLRDVLFQRDPFDPPLGGLELALEEPRVTIATEPWTRAWMQDVYGAREVAALGAEVVSCSGTTIGRREDMLRYLSAMSQEIEGRWIPFGSHDQAVHNHLLRHGRLGEVTLAQNGRGRVLTMAGMSRVERDGEGRVLNADGTVPAVLHQYDRFRGLAVDLLARLGGLE